MTIDGWTCEELWPGTAWTMRTARHGNVEVEASDSGIELRESGLGYLGATGSYALPANVFMWLAQAVRL